MDEKLQNEEVIPQKQSTNLVGEVGEVKMTITITRAITGKQETYDLVGKVMEE